MPIEEYFPFDGNNIVFLVTIYEILATKINCKTFDLEIDGHSEEVKKRDLRRSTENVRIYIGEFFRILATRQRSFTQVDAHNVSRGPQLLEQSA